ncbi:hypothetical protein EXN66_Car010272 [Channa argus]|uniref:Uncharacterized protein n=1 Tax=Channa argus TaxID=215402 RepID=A0A6G1PX97_CHAAH|nr:hypothetical protein EXN66_Car010272 [Channa argus]
MCSLSQLENRLQTDSVQPGSSGPWRPLHWCQGAPRTLAGSSGPRAGQLEAQSVEGSTAQWLEVGRTHNEAPTICPGIPSDQDVQLGRPSQGLTALHNPIHKTH